MEGYMMGNRKDIEAVQRLSSAERKWIDENANAFDCWNFYVEKQGLPLEAYRTATNRLIVSEIG